jgi:hypothetical protein
MKLMRLLVLALLGCGIVSAQPGWYNPSWAYRKAIRVPKKFVLYTDRTPPPFIYDLCQQYDTKRTTCLQLQPGIAAHALASYNDIRFTAGDGVTLLNRTRTSAGSTIFFIANVLSKTQDSVIYMYYGNPNAPDQSSAGAYDAATQNAYHGSGLADDSGNRNTCTVNMGTFTSELTTSTPAGQAFWFDGNTLLKCPTAAIGTFGKGYTIEAWIKGYTRSECSYRNGHPLVMSAGGGLHWAFGFGYDGCYFHGFKTDNTIPSNFIQPHYSKINFNPYRDMRGDRWYHVAFTWNGSTITQYLNGVNVGSNAYAGPPASGGWLMLGGNGYINSDSDCSTTHQCYMGWIADVKLSNVARSAGWFATEYANAWYPQLFYQTGNEETNTSTAPVIVSFSGDQYILTGGDKATLSWFVDNAGSVSIDHGIGSQSAVASGSVSVAPTTPTIYTLTAANRAGSVTASWTVTPISSGLYLRSGPPFGTSFCGYSSSPTKVYVCGGQYNGYHIGSKISVYGLCANDPAHHYFPNFSNHLLVTGMTDAGTLTVANLDGSAITPNGSYLDACNSDIGVYESGGEVTLYPMPPAIFGGAYDGPTGDVVRHLGTDSTNGLSSLTCSSGNCAVIFNYNHDAKVNDKVSVWGTTSPGSLNSSMGKLDNTGSYTLHEFSIATLTPDGCTAAVNCTGFTFRTSNPADNGNYTSNRTCAGNGGTSRECVVVSLWGISANTALLGTGPNRGAYFWVNAAKHWGTSPPGYACVWDGGAFPCDTAMWTAVGSAAQLQYLDRKNTALINGLIYYFTHTFRANGPGWSNSENPAEAGNSTLLGFPDQTTIGMEWVQLAMPLLSPAQKSEYLDSVLGDVWYANSSTPCNKTRSLTHPQPSETISGIARGGDPTSITLAASDTGTSCSSVGTGYCGMAVYTYQPNSAGRGDHQTWGYIVNYDAATKKATIQTPAMANWFPWNAPAAGWFYMLMPTATWDQDVKIGARGNGGHKGTLTAYGSHFTRAVPLGVQAGSASPWRSGDAFAFPNVFLNITVDPDAEVYITKVIDDTHAAVMMSDYTVLSNTVPQPLYWLTGWLPGDCGCFWHLSHTISWAGGLSYPPTTILYQNSTEPQTVDNKLPTDMTSRLGALLSMAASDSRAAYEAEYWWNFLNDWSIPFGIAASGGQLTFSSRYNWQVDRNDKVWADVYYKFGNGFQNKLDVSGAWTRNTLYFKVYDILPDKFGGQLSKYPTSSDSAGAIQGDSDPDYYWDAWSMYNPNTALAAQLRNFLETNGLYWQPDRAQSGVGSIDPRIPSNTTYTTLSHQRALLKDSKAACQAYSGWTCWPDFQDKIVFSLASQSGGAAAWSDRSATMAAFNAVATPENAYQQGAAASLGIAKVGAFLGCDANGIMQTPLIPTVNCDMPLLSSAPGMENRQTPLTPEYVAPQMDRWASFGNSDPEAGDPDNKVVAARIDERRSYTARFPAALRYMTHFKKPGLQEVIFDREYINTTGAKAGSITTHRHFRQVPGVTPREGVYYKEGSTTCPGAGGCANLNGNGRVVLVQQSGEPADANGPARAWNMTAGVLLPYGANPSSVQMTFDGHTYPGAAGFTERVTVCGGTCGGNATVLNYAWVYEIQPQPGTSFVLTSLNAGSNWMVGQTANQVAAFSADATKLQTSLSVTTTFSGTAQHMIHDLAPGTYTVAVNGSTVLRAVNVVADDNTLYFEATAGSLTVTRGCSITTTSAVPAGTVGVSYSGTLTTAGCTSPLTWSVASGSLPSGLSLNPSTGVISGTPTTAGTSSFTVRAVDKASNTATQALSLTNTSVSVACTPNTGPAIVGLSWSIFCSASGGSPPYSWSIAPGSLPAGITGPNSSIGGSVTISGAPTTSGPFSFTVKVTDSVSNAATQAFSGAIAGSTPGG